MQVLLHLIECGRLAPSEFVELCALQMRRQEPIGRLALRKRSLTIAQIFRVIEAQSNDDRPFGEIAVALGFLTRQRLRSLLEQQHKNRPTLQSLALEKGFVTERELVEARRAMRRKLISHEPSPSDTLAPKRIASPRRLQVTENLT
jgi:hypothetical protein